MKPTMNHIQPDEARITKWVCPIIRLRGYTIEVHLVVAEAEIKWHPDEYSDGPKCTILRHFSRQPQDWRSDDF